MTLKVKIKLTVALPIAKEHGCFVGEEFDAEYKNTAFQEGEEVVVFERDKPVKFIGKAGEECVAFSREYEVI